MSANSVLPPFAFTTRADSSEYLAGIARNELSECHSMLPRLNSRWRLSRGSGLPSLPRLETSFMPVGQALVLRLGDVAAARVLDVAEIAGERHLLLVGELLVVEHQHGMLVHAGLDGRHVLRARGLVMSTPDTSPTNTGWSWRIETGMRCLHCVRPPLDGRPWSS